ncbi:MAG: lipopolysaccharide transport periplasmic protein LptA [Burkholderiales bacterium]|nr:lipopolysaccharide transport periplasmic protein LptA [Burkholderiales bacterium]
MSLKRNNTPAAMFQRPGRASAARVVFLAALCAYAFAWSPNGHAEKADREKPINLEADRVTVDDAKQISTFEGSVILTQGTLVIRGDRMEVRQDAQGFQYGTTWGNLAYFRQKREGFDEFIEGWAERIEYDGRADKVQMFKRASMKRGQDNVRGNYISYDANTEFFQVTGAGKAAAPDSPDRRVRAVMQPKAKDQDKPASPAQPLPLKPAATLTILPEEIGAARK